MHYNKYFLFFPFDSKEKYSSTTLDNNITYIKGAIEKLLPNINYYLNRYGEEKILLNRKSLSNIADGLTKKGIRVLALCYTKNNNWNS